MKEKQPTFEIIYSKEFFSDLKIHKQSGNKQILKKIDTFLDELEETPTKGTGQRNVYSKIINGKHRFIFEVFEEEKKSRSTFCFRTLQ